MDTDPKYRNDAILEVEYPPDKPSRETHIIAGTDNPPVDGWVHILYRDPDDPQGGRNRDGRWYAGSYPFRDHRDDGHAWFARPDANEWNRHPIWKWQNPDADPHTDLTLSPSIGKKNGDGDINFHCWVENGSIRWV